MAAIKDICQNCRSAVAVDIWDGIVFAVVDYYAVFVTSQLFVCSTNSKHILVITL